MNITASGGVSTLEDVRMLKEIGVFGAIIGKAYYTGAIRLEDALEVAR
jgi:phosphoribosylformimino-5-aminoimidazole carboxamide ribotide isomerase